MNRNILIADDDLGVLSALNMLLKSEKYIPKLVNTPEQALAAIQKTDFALVLLDLNYTTDTTSGNEGIQLIQKIRAIDEFLPIVVMTGWGTIEIAVEIMKIGANDFIKKPWDNIRLLGVVKNQMELANVQLASKKLAQQNKLLRAEIYAHDAVIAHSPAIQDVMSVLNKVAKTDANILLTGENGTGKSMFARYIHERSLRRQKTQISVNMGAVTEQLFESEMFGHVKGAFTDAKETRIGRFELADQGTIFLDEIANTPYSQQAKLLRVLEESTFEKVGSSKTQHVDVRLITATNSNLALAVEKGGFRKDLLYRINTIEIEIPPLRKRVEDIIPLAVSILRKISTKYAQSQLTISPNAKTTLVNYDWPGNVRELGHVMERAHILSKTPIIETEDLGISINESDVDLAADSYVKLQTLDALETEILKKRLKFFELDAKKTADSLGLSRSAFYRKLKKTKR